MVTDAPKQSRPRHWKTAILVVVVLILAVLAGIGGAVLTNFSIFPTLAEVPYFQKYLETDAEGHTIFKLIEKETEIVSEDEAIYSIMDATKPAVVSVVVQASGIKTVLPEVATGFIVSADGLVVTNKHMLLDNTATVKVVRDDYWVYDAEVVARDPLNDIALLKIGDDNLPVANLYPREEIKLGQQVIALGNKYDRRENFVSQGVLSAVNKGVLVADQENLSRLEGLLETDAVIGQM
ncbi:S1C family serine protease, partial [Patescibacteria group bacterium]